MRKISYRFVYNRKKSLNDRGTALVQVEAYLNKKKVYFSTHVYLRPEQWDVKRKIIKEHPNQDALNGMLNEFIIELEKKELSLWRQGKTITLSLIKEEFKSNTDASFLGFARKEIMSSQLKDSTKRNHLTTISLLQSFKPTIEFEDLTYNFVTDFEKFLYDSDYQTNTVAKHMKHLKSFVNAAINKGYIDPNNLSSLYNPTMVLRRSLQYSYLRRLLQLFRHYHCLMHSLQVPDVIFHVCLLHLRSDGS